MLCICVKWYLSLFGTDASIDIQKWKPDHTLCPALPSLHCPTFFYFLKCCKHLTQIHPHPTGTKVRTLSPPLTARSQGLELCLAYSLSFPHWLQISPLCTCTYTRSLCILICLGTPAYSCTNTPLFNYHSFISNYSHSIYGESPYSTPHRFIVTN